MSCRVISVVTTVVILLTGCGGESAGKSFTSPPRPAPTASLPTSPLPAEDPPLGSEADADPARVIIDSIDVDADLVGVGLADDGSMETPEYHTNTAGWYTEGPEPGEQGPAVVVAHVDGPDGTDVFWDLRGLEVGDDIVVHDTAGDIDVFTVTHTLVADKDALPYDQIWPDTDEVLLSLITCDGPYTDGEYEDNLVVFAELTS